MMRFLGRLFAGSSEAERSGQAKATSAKVEARKKAVVRVGKAPTGGARAKPAAPPDPDDDEHFDPYNTGVFDRGAPWERIRKHK